MSTTIDSRVIRRAVDVNWQNLALGHDVFETDGATFVRNTSLPLIYDANFVFGMRVSSVGDIERLLLRAAQEFAHAAQLTFRVDPFTSPAFEARLALDGYARTEAIVMLLDDPIKLPARPVGMIEIRAIDEPPEHSNAGAERDSIWLPYIELKLADWREHASRAGLDPDDTAIPTRLMRSNRLKCPPVQYYVAYVDGRAVGFCSAWRGLDGMGQVEDLFVLPDFRHRGIATALLHRCVAVARAGGDGPVVIVSDAADTPKTMYHAMGWQPVAVCRQYGKKVSPRAVGFVCFESS